MENSLLTLCVTCPPLGAPYEDEALLLIKQNIMQKDVKIELESRDKVRGFAESLWESDKNIEVVRLENGLAKLRNTFVFTRVATYNDLVRAQETAKTKKLNKFWTMVDFMSNVEDQTGLVQLCSLVYITVPSSMEADKFLSEQILKKELSATIVLLDSEGEMINCDELGGDEEDDEEVEQEDDDGESDEDDEEEEEDDDDKEGDEENENDELE
ncbi:acidic leucine-rich nuclear phosphoprotein 32 family member E-like [Pyrus x bretschneideri]|uniref:acidic leucine-rich nuclear phosphoprotein 32 family member E-like n=1 Tax=Pyrus x bretschneideri TaxID=225117 RepID=UPI00202DE487|nr:acidic leucine-rich nuclear phosphoprotein 32 family member E-like [Pyrus x bretschneideri]